MVIRLAQENDLSVSATLEPGTVVTYGQISENAGELSGYTVEVDPNQNVLASSTVEFVIKNIAVGVMRKIKVKIGFTNKI